MVDARRVQLEVTNAELAVLTERLTEVDQLKTQLFANVSHELRTPLALILGPLEKLRGAGGLTQDQRHDVEVVERNARMVLRHVNDLLDVSKLEAGRMELGCTDVDLARVVRLSAAHFETLVQERQIAFAVETTPSVPAHVDPEKLQSVFLNLLSNAFKFTPDGGQVRCVLDAVGEHVAVAIQDSGPGVPPALREAIFDRFHQGDGGTTRRVGGTGLGLAIAKEFVELHGGTITVEDAPGGGALLSVVLPLVAPMGPGLSQAEEEHSLAADVARQAVEALRPHPVSVVPAAAETEQALVLVINYLTNALTYSRADQPIDVGLQADGGMARVWVRDEGPGVPPAEHDRIWERAYQVAGLKPQSGSHVGLGLGLYISRSIVERHKGQVGVESMPGQGATFWFTLPLASPA